VSAGNWPALFGGAATFLLNPLEPGHAATAPELAGIRAERSHRPLHGQSGLERSHCNWISSEARMALSLRHQGKTLSPTIMRSKRFGAKRQNKKLSS
jgi:hypothetical protein